MASNTVNHYDENASRYAQQYDSLDAETVHESWASILHQLKVGNALDVGAGSGRDARWLAHKGWSVDAVEPAAKLRDLAATKQKGDIAWHDDNLPQLESFFHKEHCYGLILLSAVWMHLPPIDRYPAMQTLSSKLEQGGVLVISLRFGPQEDEREMFPVSGDEVNELALEVGLKSLSCHQAGRQLDQLQRSSVYWETVAFMKTKGSV